MTSMRRIARRDLKWNRYLDKIAGAHIITFSDAKRIGIKIPPGYNEGPRRRRSYIRRPVVGQMVCDCRLKHQRIVAIHPADGDYVELEDGFACSFAHCCDRVPHGWKH